MKYLVREPDNLVIAVIDPSLSRIALIGLTDMMTAQSGILHTGYDGELPEVVSHNSMDILCAEIEMVDVIAWANAVETGMSVGIQTLIPVEEVNLAKRILGRELCFNSMSHYNRLADKAVSLTQE